MKHRGIALLTGLVLLAAISLLALFTSSGMILQRHMAANFEQDTLALESAALADTWAKAWVYSRPAHDRERGCFSGCVLPAGFKDESELPPYPELEALAWWQANGVPAGTNPDTGETLELYDAENGPPRWVVSEIHYASTGDEPGEKRAESIAYYRILSRGKGRHGTNVAVTESIIARPWGGDFQPGNYPPQGSARLFCEQFAGRYECGNLSWRRRR